MEKELAVDQQRGGEPGIDSEHREKSHLSKRKLLEYCYMAQIRCAVHSILEHAVSHEM